MIAAHTLFPGKFFSVLTVIMVLLAMLPSVAAGQSDEFSTTARAADEFGNAQDMLGMYVINPLDQLVIVVYAGERKIGEYEEFVKSDGTVYLPFLERDVRLGDLRLLEAESLLERLSMNYIKSPRIVITVVSSTHQFVSTYGRIASRNVEIKTPIRVLQLIAQVGGPEEGAKADSIRVISLDGTIRYFNYERVNENPTEEGNFFLKPGDIVFVPSDEDYSVVVLGNVQNPGQFEMRYGQKILDAILAAGSWGAEADIENVRLLRTFDTGRSTVREIDVSKIFNDGRVEQNIALQDGDMVFIPTKRASALLQRTTMIIQLLQSMLTAYVVYVSLGD